MRSTLTSAEHHNRFVYRNKLHSCICRTTFCFEKKARFPAWRNKSSLGNTAEDNDEEDAALRLKVSKRH